MNENTRLGIIGGLVVGVPILAVVAFSFYFFSSGMATADSGDHAKLVQLETQIAQLNSSLQNVNNFLVNQQIPFDQQVLNYTHHHQ